MKELDFSEWGTLNNFKATTRNFFRRRYLLLMLLLLFILTFEIGYLCILFLIYGYHIENLQGKVEF